MPAPGDPSSSAPYNHTPLYYHHPQPTAAQAADPFVPNQSVSPSHNYTAHSSQGYTIPQQHHYTYQHQPQPQLQPQVAGYLQGQPANYVHPNTYPSQNYQPQPQPLSQEQYPLVYTPQQQQYSLPPTQYPPAQSPQYLQPTQSPIAYTSINPSVLHTSPYPAEQALPAVPSQPRVTLRISRPAPNPAPPVEMAPRLTSRSSVSIKTEQILGPSGSGRPLRSAAQQASQQLHQQAADEDSIEEDDEDEGTIENDDDEALAVPEDNGRRRSGRDRKAPTLYADSQEISPPVRRVGQGQGQAKSKRRVVDPDESEGGDGDYGEVQPPRNPFPPRRTSRNSMSTAIIELPSGPVPSYTNGPAGYTNGRTTRSSKPAPPTPAKSRASSADAESFHPSQSEAELDGDGELDGEGSPDPLGGQYIDEDTPSVDEGEGYGRQTRSRAGRSAPNRKPNGGGGSRRPTGGAGGGTRRSARTIAATRSFDMHGEVDDDFTIGGRGGGGASKRNLRTRVPVNYRLPPADISTEMTQEDLLREAVAGVSRPGGGANGRGVRFGPGTGASRNFGGGPKSLAWGLQSGMGGRGGAFARAMGDDSSDSDDLMTPLKPTSGASANASGSAAAGLVGGPKISAPTDVKDFGRINPKSSTADADPLGVDMNVTFDNVGGLDGHIDQLKEMVALPLLYPEVFQQFGITPPRGVLFHGPPGTGKTLLARALAASCSNGNTKISFFMRKGADVLSKWVGEAERQLRMLFEEARAAQPSIIFFDEIDGLAPVRSSKQDQIHASLVSTLLALMDGMDGRGQVIVIGATNRPDSVDPALRRPGRFDREFYFPLPNKEARKKIIQINTRVWNPPLEDGLVEMLAGVTKGYGGADMRALCTEAALNAIQRRYPQIYKSTDRFELDTASIQVKAKDFLMSVKKIIPSSARSTTSTAIPLPTHLVPLLSAPLDRLKKAVDDVLPRHKDRTALEEAMFEEDEGDLAGAEILQTLDKMRTYRPRLLVSGTVGMGQTYLGPAILHHLEGFHVQNFDLGILLSDSSRTVEAALVQLFIEAKRHQPSILYIPALVSWSNTLSDSAKATFKSLLDGIQPSEPILLLGLAEDGEVREDVRDWFGWDEEGEVELSMPKADERAEYFSPLITHINTPPNMWPDALPRRPRVLEQLKIAAPLPPRQPTEAEIAKERERDVNARNMMVLSFTGLVGEFARKYKRVVASVREDAFLYHGTLVQDAADQAAAISAAAQAQANAEPGSAVDGNSTIVPTVEVTDTTEAGIPMSNGRTQSLPPNDADLSHPSDISTSNSQPLPTASGSSDDPLSQNISTSPLRPAAARASSVLTDLTSSQPAQSYLGLLGPAAVNTAPSTQTSTQPLPAGESAAGPPGPLNGPDWTPHDIDTDTLSRRLAKHKYYRPADFLADVDKIKANADKIGDVDRQNKVAEMVSHAYLHVAEFDPRWVPEFDAYAERMRIRREKRDEEKKRKDAGEKMGEGEELAVLDKGKKRLREEGEEGDVEMEDGDAQPEKRSRIEDGDNTTPIATSSITVNGDIGDSSDTPSILPPVPAPAPIYPTFVVPSSKLADLTRALVSDTDGFTIEELEQLRAGLFGRIWKKRGEWEREELIDELRAFLEKMGRGIKGRNEG